MAIILPLLFLFVAETQEIPSAATASQRIKSIEIDERTQLDDNL